MQKLSMVVIIALAGCVEEPIDGRSAYLADCAGCHGVNAKGNGEIGQTLATTPPDLTTIAARNGGNFPRNQVMSTIDGLNRGAHFSTAMPEFGAGDLGETVVVEDDGLGTPVPVRLLLLTDYLESIQQ